MAEDTSIGTVEKPVEVSANAPTLDTTTALIRYIVVIITAIPVVMALLRNGDIIAILDFMRGTSGATLIAAIVGLATLLYGLYKTYIRGAQIKTVATDVRVPNMVAKLKGEPTYEAAPQPFVSSTTAQKRSTKSRPKR